MRSVKHPQNWKPYLGKHQHTDGPQTPHHMAARPHALHTRNLSWGMYCCYCL